MWLNMQNLDLDFMQNLRSIRNNPNYNHGYNYYANFVHFQLILSTCKIATTYYFLEIYLTVF